MPQLPNLMGQIHWILGYQNCLGWFVPVLRARLKCFQQYSAPMKSLIGASSETRCKNATWGMCTSCFTVVG